MSVTAVSGDVLVPGNITGEQRWPRVASFADGSYVVAWMGRDTDDSNGIVFQRFSAAGVKLKADGTPLDVGQTMDEVRVNATVAGSQFYPRIETLSNGSFVVSWSGPDDSSNDVFMRLYGANGAALTGEVRVVANESGRQAEPSVAEVDGGFVVNWASSTGDISGYGIFAQRFDLAGNFVAQSGASNGNVRANFQVSQSTSGDQGWHSVTSLDGGRALHTYSTPDANVNGVRGRIMEANGTLGAEFRISSEAGDWQVWSEATQLANGNIVVAWTAHGQDGSANGIYARIFDASGNPIGSEFRVNVNVWVNQGYHEYTGHGASLAALADGGFAIAYYVESGDGSNHASYVRRYDAAGNADGSEILVNVYTDDHQYAPDLVATDDGFRVFWNSHGQDGSGWGIYSRDFDIAPFVPAEQIVRTGGEDQVNVDYAYQQRNSQVTSFDDGSYVVTWASQSSLSAGDGSGWGLFAQRYDAQGRMITRGGDALGADQFQLNEFTAGDQGFFVGGHFSYTTATLSDGRFIAAWDSYAQPGGSEWDAYARIFNADGTAGAEFRVNGAANIASEDAFPDVAMLHGPNEGGFVVTYRTANQGSSYDVWGQRYDETGATVGAEFRVTAVSGANTSDGSEHQGRVQGLADGGFVVVFTDSGNDGSGEGLFGRVYDAAGVAGTTFAIAQRTGGDQHAPSLGLLQNGNFVVTWISGDGDPWGVGVRARIFAADGVPVTPEFRVNNAFYGTQTDIQVAVLKDGSFVVVFASDEPHHNPAGWDIFAARFDASGSQIGTEILVNRSVSGGNERHPRVAATENGFVVTWEQESAGSDDGDAAGIFRQEFTIDGLNGDAAGEQAEAPLVLVGSANPNLIVNGGAEDGPRSTDWNTTTVPTGWTAVSGAGTAIAYSLGGPNDLNNADSNAVDGGAAYFSGGNAASSVLRQTIDVSAKAGEIDTGRIFASIGGDFGGWQNNADSVAMVVSYRNATNVEVGSVTLGNVSAAERNNLSQLLHRAALSAVPVGTRTIVVELVTVRAEGVSNDGYADNLSLSLTTAAVGAEDSAIPVPVTILSQDANAATAETMRVEIAAIPAGATISDGQYSFTATAFDDAHDVSDWDFASITVTPPANSNADFTLEIRVTAIEDQGGGDYDSKSTIVSVAVDVTPAPDAVAPGAPGNVVNSHVPGEQSDPQIARSADGAYLVTWHSVGQDQAGTFGVYAQRFGADGVPAGTEFRVNVATNGYQSYAQSTWLADGSFVVVWQSEHVGGYKIYQRHFAADGTPLSGEQQVNTTTGGSGQYAANIVALADGGYVVGWHSDGPSDTDPSTWGVFAQRYNASGAAVSRDGLTPGAQEFQLNTTTLHLQAEPQFTATEDGGFIAVWVGESQTGDAGRGVYGQRFNAAGAAVGPEFHANQATDGTQEYPVVTLLSNGNFVVAWHSDSANDGDADHWGISARLYDSAGNPLTNEFTANTYFGSEQAWPTVAALDGGRFAIAWQSYNQDADGYGVYGQLFEADGDKDGQEMWLSTMLEGHDYRPQIVQGTDGNLVAVWQSGFQDGSSTGIVIREIAVPAEPVYATGGERMVPTTVAHEQSNPDMATLSDGGYVVTWQTKPSQGAGDVSDWSVRAQRYDAAGNPLGMEVTVNSGRIGDQSQPSITALDDGGYVIVWNSATGDGNGYGIYGQKFAADGTADGAEFQVNAVAAGNQVNPEVTALHGDQAGGFAVSWQQDAEIFARAFDGAGAAIGGNVAVVIHGTRANIHDSAEVDARITGTNDGGFVVVWQDSDADGNGWTVNARRFDVTGGAVVGAPGTHSDGTEATDAFRVNSQYYGNQLQPTITTLADGAMVIAWYSDTGAQGAGVYGRIYEANGALRGGEFNIEGRLANVQYEPDVTALSDGSFVVVWRDQRIDELPGDEIYGRRFDGNGTMLNEFRVNSSGVGAQFQPVVTEVGNGFTVSWTTDGAQDGFGGGGGESYGIFQQHFAIDRAAEAGDPVAQRPTLTLGAIASGNEDTAISLDVAAALADTGNGDETLTLVIENVPLGAKITDGNPAHVFVSTRANPSVDIAGWNLGALTITPPVDYNGSFTLNLRATATEQTGDQSFNAGTIKVVVAPVAEVIPPYGAEQRDNVHTNDHQMEPMIAVQADGTYMVVWRSQGQPGQPYYTVMAQMHAADGTKIGSEFNVNAVNNNAYTPDVTSLAGGGYLVTFTHGGDGSGEGVFAQRMSATGAKLKIDGSPLDAGQTSGEVLVNNRVAGTQGDSEVQALADGGWVVVWIDDGQDTSGYGIHAQRYDSAGVKVGMDGSAFVGPATDTRVNVTVAGHQHHPGVTQFADGTIGVTWSSPDLVGNGVFARMFRPDGTSTGEIQVSSTAAFNQQTTPENIGASNTFVALNGGGGVIAWNSYGQDGSNSGIYAQMLNPDGTLVGSEFRVNSYGYDHQQEPHMAALPDGGFIVVWTSIHQDGSGWGAYGQRYDAAGDPVGTEFRINRTSTGEQSSPTVAVQPDGSLVLAYEGPDGNGDGIIHLRLPFTDANLPQAIEPAAFEQQVNTTAVGDQLGQRVARLDDGSYVVVWQSNSQDAGNSVGIYARHFTAGGDPILWSDGSTEMLVNLTTFSNQQAPAIAGLPGGGFVVAYESAYGNTTWDIYARRFDNDGTEVKLKDANGNEVSELRVSDGTTGDDHNAIISAAPVAQSNADASFTIAFQSNRDGDSWSIQSHHVDGTGQLAAGGDILVNQNTTSQQLEPEIARLADGSSIVVWHSLGHDGSGWGAYGRRLDASGNPVGEEFLVNTRTDAEQSWPDVAALTDGGFVVVWNTLTGFDTDDSSYAIAGQRFDHLGNAVGGEFQINGIGRDGQLIPNVIGTQDGGFIVGWNSENADGNHYAVYARRFDADGQPTEPFGNDFQVNTYAPGPQMHVDMALLDRGFVAVWQSQGQDGPGSWSVQMQRFEGAGLEPPPYIVDAATGGVSSGDTVFATIQEAVDAAEAANAIGQTILIKGGTYNENVTVNVDDLRFINEEEAVVTVVGTGGSAFTIAAGFNAKFEGDLAANFVISATGADTIHFAGNNSGSHIDSITVQAESGNSAVTFAGGQNGVQIEGSIFTGAGGGAALIGISGSTWGGDASSNVNIIGNSFDTDGGPAIYSEATGGEISQNVFAGTTDPDMATLWLEEGGVDVNTNSFAAQGGPHFLDVGNYAEATIIAQNNFPNGWARIVDNNVIYAELAQALGETLANETLLISGGDWTQDPLTVAVNNLTISAPGGAQGAVGIDLVLGAGVTHLTLADGAAIDVTGNGLANVIVGNHGANQIDGAAGNDVLSGGEGADTLTGGAGVDTLNGDGGADTLNGGAEDDVLNGGWGADLLDGGTGNDVMAGNHENDAYVVDSLGDVVNEALNDGTDEIRTALLSYTLASANVENLVGTSATGQTLTGSAIGNVVTGGAGNDMLDGGAGNDTLSGGEGDDLLKVSGTGVDTAHGNAGSDTLVLDYSGDTDGLALTGGLVSGANGYDGRYADLGPAEDRDQVNDATFTGIEHFHVTTGSGADTILTGAGNDLLDGGAGADSLTGGAGNDAYVVSEAGDTVVEGADAGTDEIRTALASFSLADRANVENLTGTSATGQMLTGSGGGNVITGAGGNDMLDGGAGADSLAGGSGNDTYVVDDAGDTATEAADSGTDHVQSSVSFTLGANVENLTLTGAGAIDGTGNALVNAIVGNGAANLLDGGTGADTLTGGGGNDTYVVDNASDTVVEAAAGGTDTVQSSVTHSLAAEVENLTLTGAGAINATGNGVANIIFGNSGANRIDGGAGGDKMTGGDGNDTYIVAQSGDVVTELAAEGTDTVESAISYTLGANVENLVLTGSAGNSGTGNAAVNSITGNSGANTLDGGAGADTLAGGGGNDIYLVDNAGDTVTEAANAGTDEIRTALAAYSLAGRANVENLTGTSATGQTLTGNELGNAITGGAGNDVIDGGTGADAMAGGAGNDSYVVDNALDTVTELAGGGIDSVSSSVTHVLAAEVENLILTGSGAIDGTGNALANAITGNSGANRLDGGAGADTLSGGGGNDTYVVDVAGDIVTEAAGAGSADTVESAVNYTLGANLENLVLTGTAANATGNALNNAITGNASANVLDGGAGADAMTGGAGNDLYKVDNAGDSVVELAGGGTDTVESSITQVLAAEIENLTLTGSGAIDGTGNVLANTIAGNNAANKLDGGAGIDALIGGAGNDTYIVDSSSDVVTELAGGGSDSVEASASYVLSAEVETLKLTGSGDINGTGNGLANVITGNSGANRIDGGAGGDLMAGGAGNDVYVVDDALDTVAEAPGNGTDTVESSVTWTLGAEFENLVLTGAGAIDGTGNALANSITGNGAANLIDGGAGVDTMAGGLGNDIYVVDVAGDIVTEAASAGTDTIRTALATFTLVGRANVENLTGTLATGQTLTGTGGVNTIVGAGGNDTINAGSGADTMVGNGGDDTYTVDNAGDVVTEATGGGNDTIRTTVSLTLAAEVENLVLTGADPLNGTGNALANSLTGNAGANRLDGGAGADAMAGGLGDDVYVVDNALDTAVEAAGGGTDMVEASVTFTLGADVEKLVLTGAGAINGTGNALANTITGNGAANVLDGGAGADTLTGGLGNDTYVVDDAADAVVELAGGGTDTVQASVSHTLAAEVENLVLTGVGAIAGTGNGLANAITGNGAANLLDGGAGADALAGGGGDDSYVVDNAGDVVTEAAGAGTDNVQSSVSFTLGANLENLTLTGGSAIDGTGNGGANLITGNDAANRLDGGAGADTMTGGLGNDIYVVDAAGDQVVEAASGGTDTLESAVSWTLGSEVENLVLTGAAAIDGTGNALANAITGNNAANLLDGGAGADALAGGGGNDVYIVDEAGDTVIEAANEGTDEIRTALAAYSLAGIANVEKLTGTSGAGQTLTGNALANVIAGAAGADTIDGGAGADSMAGGLGNDIYVVDDAGDTVTEGASGGTDTVQSAVTVTIGAEVENLVLTGTGAINGTGNALANAITGNSGNNLLDGGAGADTLTGGLGNDIYVIDHNNDAVIENAGEGIADEIRTAAAIFSLVPYAAIERLTYTGAVAATLTGNALDNFVSGGAGADVIDGGAGADQMAGGLGNDSYTVDNAADTVVELAGGGTDTVNASASHVLSGEVENLTLTGSGAINGTGNALANAITGNSGANVINGGAGADTMTGGLGNDRYVVDNALDKVIEASGGGTDTVESSVSFSLTGHYAEKLILTGSAVTNATGNSLANELTGNSAANKLDGGGGADIMAGLGGNDRYVVDNINDKVIEAANEGTDTVESSANFSIAGQFVEVLKLTGTADIKGIGNNLANTISGNGGINLLNGQGGADAMDGGAGNDRYIVDNLGDTVLELAAGGTDRVDSAVTWTLGDNVENLVMTGNAVINGTGNAQANIILGNSAGNVIDGGAGADQMEGGLGNDRYVVDDIGDKILELSGGGTDTVDASVSYSLAGQFVETLRLTGTAAINGTGNNQVNSIYGNEAANGINGGGGDDKLYGGAGNDTLTGGAGLDRFIFDSALNGATNVDRLADFTAADDAVYLDRVVFANLGTGTVAATAFVTGAAALDAGDRVIYDASTGNIWFDADGTGAGAQVLFATVAAGTALTNADFIAF